MNTKMIFGGSAIVIISLLLAPSHVDANPAVAVAAVSAGAEAGKALTGAVQEVSKSLSSGSSNEAYVKWVGDLDYSINEIHGKVIQEGHNKRGGIIAVTKVNSGFYGAEHKVTFKDPKTKENLAEVFLETFWSGAQPKVRFTYGEEHFLHKTVEKNGSAALVIELKPKPKPKSQGKKSTTHGKGKGKGKAKKKDNGLFSFMSKGSNKSKGKGKKSKCTCKD